MTPQEIVDNVISVAIASDEELAKRGLPPKKDVIKRIVEVIEDARTINFQSIDLFNE